MNFNDINSLRLGSVLFAGAVLLFFILWVTGVFKKAVGTSQKTNDEIETWTDPCPVGSTFCQDGTIRCCPNSGQCCFGQVYVDPNVGNSFM